MEIVFIAFHRDAAVSPVGSESHLQPAFVALSELGSLNLLPPIAGYLRGLAQRMTRLPEPTDATAAYLGNIWRPNGAASNAAESQQ
jgi:hypothetical protein